MYGELLRYSGSGSIAADDEDDPWRHSASENVQNEVGVETAVFRLEGLTKRYGDLLALDNATLEAGANEYISFLGPSGSGKTDRKSVV